MNIEYDIFKHLEITSLEPHDDYVDSITYGEQKQIWNRLKEKDKEIERLNNKIKEQNLLLIEFQDMEQRLKEKDNIIDELENMLINELKNSYSSVEYKQVINLILYKLKKLKGSDKDENN